jgi:hypothetical protein
MAAQEAMGGPSMHSDRRHLVVAVFQWLVSSSQFPTPSASPERALMERLSEGKYIPLGRPQKPLHFGSDSIPVTPAG